MRNQPTRCFFTSALHLGVLHQVAYPPLTPRTVTRLGDDLDRHQPFCELALAQQINFIPVCWPDSHATVYKWVNTLAALGGVSGLTRSQGSGRLGELWTYRYMNEVPLRAAAFVGRFGFCIAEQPLGLRL